MYLVCDKENNKTELILGMLRKLDNIDSSRSILSHKLTMSHQDRRYFFTFIVHTILQTEIVTISIAGFLIRDNSRILPTCSKSFYQVLFNISYSFQPGVFFILRQSVLSIYQNILLQYSTSSILPLRSTPIRVSFTFFEYLISSDPFSQELRCHI